MTRAPRVLVVVNSESSGPRRLALWLREFGIELEERLGSQGLPETLDGFDGLVLLGGGFMPDDLERAPWLAAERGLAAAAIERDLPTLGVCLGAQLIAQVAGGEVRAKHGTPERGSVRIRVTATGVADPVLGAMGAEAPMIEHHEDVITRLPDGARLLASSDAVENQAFVLGSHVRGVQFHPESSAENVAGWDAESLAKEGVSLAELMVAADADDEANTRASRALIAAFGEEVRGRSRA